MASKILIPGKLTYKEVDVDTGAVKIHFQPRNAEKIKDILLQENGENKLLFRIENKVLTIILTTKCDHKCIMCPQQLNIDLKNNDLLIKQVVKNLNYSVINEIYLTGGEPLLKIDFINSIEQNAPKKVFITILTNGSILPSKTILNSNRVKLCIPLYSSYDELHNYLTGSKSFYKVINNLMYISNFPILIELRFVLLKQNVSNLLEYARFVYRNLPFVQDVAFMGMELMASAKLNKDILWINPREYIPDLIKAVTYLENFGIKSWIYNLQPCLFDKRERNFLSSSISYWKRKYLSVCNECKLKKNCGGIFFSDMREYEQIILEAEK